MSSQKSRMARRAAYEYAAKERIWDKIKLPSRSRWSRFLDWLLPKHRTKTMKQEMDMRGRWYKRALKYMARQVYKAMHDPDYAEMSRVQRKLARQKAVKSRFVNAVMQQVKS